MSKPKRGRKPTGKHIWIDDKGARDPENPDRTVKRCRACGTLDYWELARDACPMANQYIAKQQRLNELDAKNRRARQQAAAAHPGTEKPSATRARPSRRTGHRR